jgi:hypothetical protein
MLTLIGRERQQSPATVRRFSRCLSTVRAASGEASAPRTCAKASFSSLPASRPTNCSDRRQKTQIWWLLRVRRVLVLRPKIRTTCGRQGLQYFPSLHQTLSREDSEEIGKWINGVSNDRLKWYDIGFGLISYRVGFGSTTRCVPVNPLGHGAGRLGHTGHAHAVRPAGPRHGFGPNAKFN